MSDTDTLITSNSNPLVKRIKRLRQKKYRQREGVFFVEGLRVVLSAVEYKADIDAIVYCSQLLTSDIALQMLSEQQALGTRCVDLSPQIFQAISGRDHPVGLGAIVATNWQPLERLKAWAGDIFVALFEIAEPGNLGTILRTIDAAGAAGLLLVGHTVDPFHPISVKASMGSLFSVPICQVKDADSLFAWASLNDLNTTGTSAHAEITYLEPDYHFPNLLLLGSEGDGLPAEVLERVDQIVSIPMRGSASSLNLAVAAGIMLYALDKTRSSNEN